MTDGDVAKLADGVQELKLGMRAVFVEGMLTSQT